MLVSSSPGLIVLMPKLSDPRKSLTLNVTIGDPVRTATSRIRSSSGSGNVGLQWEIDLDKPCPAAKILDEIVDIHQTQTQIKPASMRSSGISPTAFRDGLDRIVAELGSYHTRNTRAQECSLSQPTGNKNQTAKNTRPPYHASFMFHYQHSAASMRRWLASSMS
jgi:hypothetical protein